MSDYRWGPVKLSEGWRFRLWAPGEDRLDLSFRGQHLPMEKGEGGWFTLDVPEAHDGDAYAFILPEGQCVPDPAARRQKGDVHGFSLLDRGDFDWPEWKGRPWAEAVICEIHIGTFTPEGTFRAAIEKLDALVDAGYTAVELMPVAQFGGTRGWGYDGVLLYCPHNCYGSPDDMRAFVAAAQERGLMVLLDVVYNHFGPDGNYIAAYAPHFFDPERHTPWGNAIHYEDPNVRDFFVGNVLFWLREFRLDGLRFDAIDHIRDPHGDTEIIAEMAEAVRAVDWGRPIHLTTEDARNVNGLHRRDADGSLPLYTAEWNDDMHNAAHVCLTGETEFYYSQYQNPWPQFARSLAEGYVFQGETLPDGTQDKGEDASVLPPLAFVDFLQNHDQIGNRAFGERLTALSDYEDLRAFKAILLLSPHIPLLFQGDEWGTRQPFRFFADFDGDLGKLVSEGRRKEFAQFSAFADEAHALRAVPDPIDPDTFKRSRIEWGERDSKSGQEHLALVRNLIRLRMERIVPHLEGAPNGCGTVVAAEKDLVAVDWRLNGGTLHLRAAFGHPNPPEAPGEIIHEIGTPDDVPHVVHSWSAA